MKSKGALEAKPLVCLAVLMLGPFRMASSAPALEETRPGLASVQFHSASLTRPGSAHIDALVNLDTGSQINDYSRLWLGSLRAPMTGELSVSAEADNGCRLHLGGKLLIDGWTGNEREGRLEVREGELYPLRLEFFQQWGTACMRLFWSWPGHPRELVPASAFGHSAADEKAVARIMGEALPAAPPRASVPAGPLPDCSRIYGTPEAGEFLVRPGEPEVLGAGPQLFLDEHLIEFSENLKRTVLRPARDPAIPNPVVTGPEDGCFQPFFTVLRDWAPGGCFRIWYGARTAKKEMSASRLAYMESGDGIDWKRPARWLDDPGPIQFGSEVLDEGPGFGDAANRYKYGWWHGGGLHVAGSKDGLHFKPLAPGVVLAHDHDINNLWRDDRRHRYVATVSSARETSRAKGPRRTTLQAVSEDLIHWSPARIVLAADDRYDEGFVQFYAMSGYLARGNLVIGLVKVLHDDWKAAGAPAGAYGVGHTSLAWTRDGEHWMRDREIFFGPDPEPGAWDHAHAWVDEQVPVGDEVYLYYGGYKWGHKHNRFEERQIGLVKLRRDRYVARQAGEQEGRLVSPPVRIEGSALTLNANVTGKLDVRLVGASGQPVPGFDWASVRGDRLAHAVEFGQPLGALAGRPLRLEFRLRQAQLFGFEVLP